MKKLKVLKYFLYTVITHSFVIVAYEGTVPAGLINFLGFIGWPYYCILFWLSILSLILFTYVYSNVIVHHIPYFFLFCSWLILIFNSKWIEMTIISSIPFLITFVLSIFRLNKYMNSTQ